MKLPIPNSYWVEPGRLLAGEHPEAGDASRTRARLEKMFEAGVRHFFDLTQPGELPPYRPLLPEGARHYSFPIPDHSIPGSDQLMRSILDALSQAHAAGGAVYVHCRAGIGRTGTVAGCWLREQGLSGDRALDELNRLWLQNARSASWPSVPETDEQYAYVQDWAPARIATPQQERSLAAGGRAKDASRFRGCLLGLAIGDVVSASAGVDAKDVSADAAGWSDDTAMTLCVAESLLDFDGFDGRDQLERYREWALDPVAEGAAGHATLRPAVRDTLLRSLQNRSAVVGSHDPAVIDPSPLARTAAAALFAGGNVYIAAALGGDVARVTHQAPFAVDTCRLFASMVTAAVAGRDKPAIVNAASVLTGMPLKPEVARVAADWLAPPGGRRSPPQAILGCLDRAVRSFLRTADFQGGIDRLLNAPGADPDATLAAYGALAGAFYGEAGLPPALRVRVAGGERLAALADRLVKQSRAVAA